MANTNRKIKIDTETDEDSTTEQTETEFDYDDGDRERTPINLDTPVDLADAIAAFGATTEKAAAEKPAAEKVAEKTPAAETLVEQRDGVESKAFRAELDSLRAEARLATDSYLRAVADLQNFRRRADEEKQRIIVNANEKLIREVLPILDDFDLAVGAAKKSESYEQLIGGVDAIVRKFRDTLAKQGVVAIAAVGEPFDTDLHEAVMVDESGEHPDDTVTEELRKGYRLNDRVIRPSLVKVAKQG